MIDSWDSFGGFSAKSDSGKTLVSLEGGAIEGAIEVLADNDTSLPDAEITNEAGSEVHEPVVGTDLDWDNV